MDEIKWSKNETISTNLTNIIYNTTDSITNGEQEYLQEDLPTNDCFNKDNRSVCLNEPNQFLNDHCKITNDNHGKLNIDGLDRQAQIQQIVENTIRCVLHCYQFFFYCYINNKQYCLYTIKCFCFFK